MQKNYFTILFMQQAFAELDNFLFVSKGWGGFLSDFFENGMLPILDVKVCVNKEEGNRLDFEFFEKPTKNSRVILANSALSLKSKRTILTQECLRRLRNTKVELGEIVQKKYLNEFMIKLKNSGYKKKFRIEVANSTLNAFAKILEDDKNEIKPLYRARSWNYE